MTTLIRPMTQADVADAEQLSAAAFLEVERRGLRRGDPDPRPRSPEHAAAWRDRTANLLRTDAGGCWVSERDGEMVGFATSIRRDTTWILVTYAVRVGLQGQGIGGPLLDAALTHARHCTRGMLSATDDARALRRYRAAGFHLHPQLRFDGVVRRDRIPLLDGIRDGTSTDRDLLDSIDRRLRDAAHGDDHEALLAVGRLLVIDRAGAEGYAYLDPAGNPLLLAALTPRTAATLLWTALAETGAARSASVRHVTAANEWAIDVALDAGLDVCGEGHLALRGMRPPTPYLHNGALL